MSHDKTAGQAGPDNDDAVSGAYRMAAREQPPASLDDAILKMAHAEVNGVHAAPGRPPWFVPLAVAATVVVAVSLGIQVLRDPAAVITESDFVSTPPASPPSAGSAMPAAAAEEEAAAFRDPVSMQNMRELASERIREPRAEAQMSRPVRPAPEPQLDSDTGSASLAAKREQAGAADEWRGDAEAATSLSAQRRFADDSDEMERAVREAAQTAGAQQRSAEDWLQMIETLHRDGEIRQAVIELRAFRRVYPQAELPPAFLAIE